MNNYEQEIRYRLLKILSRGPMMTQRQMAKEMGISLGKVNCCISELAKNGMIKINRFKNARNKIPYAYVLTPKGFEERARVTVSFMKQKIAEFEEIQHQIRELVLEVKDENLADLPEIKSLSLG